VGQNGYNHSNYDYPVIFDIKQRSFVIMNKHIVLDKMTVSVAAIAAKQFRFFADSLESMDMKTHIDAVRLRLPKLNGVGKYEVDAESLVGSLDPAFMIAQWKGAGYPTILYHHGNNERTFDMGLTSKNSFKNIFMSGRSPFPANLIALRAPFHTDLRVYMREARQLDRFAAMLAASVRLVEDLVQCVRAQTGGQVLVAGVSLGGWVTNMHKAYFDSADRYIPMLAGAALDAVFTGSIYRKLTGENVRQHPDLVQKALNFETAFSTRSMHNVYPLLGRYDSIIEYDRQRSCYGDRPVRVLEKGHTTAAMAFGDLRQHVLQTMGE
jgi:hypothetical protein